MDIDELELPELLLTEKLLQDINSGKIAASDVGATLPGMTGDKQQQFLYELVNAFSQGKLELDKFFQAVGAAGLPKDEVGTDLAHAIWLCSLRPKKDELLGDLTAECIKKGLMTRRIVLELEEPELQTASSVASSELVRKERRIYTAYYFKQDKYNLLREENEGYSKLLTLLLSGGALKQEQLWAMTREIKSLIGAFKLDPNRVCDLVLDAAERDAAGAPVWLQLMTLFNKQAPMLMLAMKFLHYAQDHQAAGDEEAAAAAVAAAAGGGGKPRPPPSSLFTLAAVMIKAGLVSLEGVLSYLSPSADSLAASYKIKLEKLREEVKELGKAHTGGSGEELPAAAAAAEAPGVPGRPRLVSLAGALDEIAKERGITDAVDDGRGGFGMRGGGGRQQQQGIMGPPGGGGPGGQGFGMGGGPGQQGLVGGGLWGRGMAAGGPGMGGEGGWDRG